MQDASETKESNNETTNKPGESISSKPGTAYDQISRQLSIESLTNPDVARMIINERDNLQAQNTQLKEIEAKYYDLALKCGILNEKLKTHTAFEVLSIGTITLGSLLCGSAINPLNIPLVGFGLFLIIVGIIAKVIKQL